MYKTYALAESIRNQKHDFVLHVLVIDGNGGLQKENCKFWGLEDLKNEPVASAIIHKYKNHADKLRWSLKPVFMGSILKAETNKVIYIDNDQFFYNDYQFLFDLLDQHSFLLTPHYYKHNPKRDQNWLEANFRVGLYNAGFAGAGKASLETLAWWAACCEYRCQKNSMRGLFDDQKYLDLVPVMDTKAHIVRHQGCNVAGWNTELCERKNVNGEVKINGEYPIVFVHYNAYTMREIEEGRDPLLRLHYDEYVSTLKKQKPDLIQNQLVGAEPVLEKIKYYIWKKATALGL